MVGSTSWGNHPLPLYYALLQGGRSHLPGDVPVGSTSTTYHSHWVLGYREVEGKY